jgi:hypothetical protein
MPAAVVLLHKLEPPSAVATARPYTPIGELQLSLLFVVHALVLLLCHPLLA